MTAVSLSWNLMQYPIQGHGSLNAIYDEVKKKATLRGWDHVDLVIIGGDFQVSPGPSM